jgi:hypothetical protein
VSRDGCITTLEPWNLPSPHLTNNCRRGSAAVTSVGARDGRTAQSAQSACCNCLTDTNHTMDEHHLRKILSDTTIIAAIGTPFCPTIACSHAACPLCIYISVRVGKASCGRCCMRLGSVWGGLYSLELTRGPALEVSLGTEHVYLN